MRNILVCFFYFYFLILNSKHWNSKRKEKRFDSKHTHKLFEELHARRHARTCRNRYNSYKNIECKYFHVKCYKSAIKSGTATKLYAYERQKRTRPTMWAKHRADLWVCRAEKLNTKFKSNTKSVGSTQQMHVSHKFMLIHEHNSWQIA